MGNPEIRLEGLKCINLSSDKEKSSVMGLEWQDKKAYDVEQEGWSPMIYDTEEIFGTGEMQLAAFLSEREQGAGFFHGRGHISDGDGVPGPKKQSSTKG